MSKYKEQKRAKRERLRGMSISDRRDAIARGERQFAEKAKGYHVEQRTQGLAFANTPARLKKLQKDKERQAKVK